MKNAVTILIFFFFAINVSHAQVDSSRKGNRKNDTSAIKHNRNNRDNPKDSLNRTDSIAIRNDKMHQKERSRKDSIPQHQ